MTEAASGATASGAAGGETAAAGVTALVLAGRRPGERDVLAEAAGVACKALVPVAGVPMLARVVGALRAAGGVDRVVVLGDPATLPPAALPAGVAEVVPAADSPAAGVAAALERFGAPLLVTTADHPLLTAAMVEHVLAATPAWADASAGVARREVVLAAYPGSRRTWLRFRGGAYTGCNLFVLRTPRAAGAVRFWRRLERERKRPLRMAALLGLGVLLRHALGRLSLPGALDALGREAGARLAAVEVPFADAAVDVDKPADLALAEAVLRAREGS